MRTVRVAVGALLLLVSAGRLPARSNPAGDQSNKGTAAGSDTAARKLPAVDPSTYIIGPRDILNISVWKEPDFSRTVPVRPDGVISLPLLNDVAVAGLTPMQLAAEITQKLKKYVSDPQVSVIVEQVNSQMVYVVGEVGHPGPMPMVPNMTVLQVISSAGGLSQWANQKHIYVMRTENGQAKRFPYNYKQALRGNTSQDIILRPGDTVVVP
jgi:polysaccharide export outer membrane protein